MLHGFMTRGPLTESAIAAAYKEGMDVALGFLKERAAA